MAGKNRVITNIDIINTDLDYYTVLDTAGVGNSGLIPIDYEPCSKNFETKTKVLETLRGEEWRLANGETLLLGMQLKHRELLCMQLEFQQNLISDNEDKSNEILDLKRRLHKVLRVLRHKEREVNNYKSMAFLHRLYFLIGENVENQHRKIAGDK